MATKTTGIEFRAFYDDESFWPGDTYVDDLVLTINGVDCDPYKEVTKDMKDSDVVIIKSGYIVDHPDYYDGSVMSYFKKWKKAQLERFIIVKIDKDHFDQAINHLKHLNYRVVSEKK